MHIESADRPFSESSMPKRAADPLESAAKVATPSSAASDDVISDSSSINYDDECILVMLIGENADEHEIVVAYGKEAVAFGLRDDWDVAVDLDGHGVLTDESIDFETRRSVAKILCAHTPNEKNAVEQYNDMAHRFLKRFDEDPGFIDSFYQFMEPVNVDRPVRIVAQLKIDMESFFRPS